MNIAVQLQQFLRDNLKKRGFSMKRFSEESGIPYITVHKICSAVSKNFELKTVLAIAEYFEISLDQLLGRSAFYEEDGEGKVVGFKKLLVSDAALALKKFIAFSMKSRSMSAFQISKNAGCGDVTIYGFIKDGSDKKMLSVNILYALADYLDVSFDEMLGREKIFSDKATDDLDKAS